MVIGSLVETRFRPRLVRRRGLRCAAHANSDGGYYANVFDAVIAPEHIGRSAGRMLRERLLAKLPFERIFVTSIIAKDEFRAKSGSQSKQMPWDFMRDRC